MKAFVKEKMDSVSSRRKCLGLIVLVSAAIILVSVQQTDQNPNVVRLAEISQAGQSNRQLVYSTTKKSNPSTHPTALITEASKQSSKTLTSSTTASTSSTIVSTSSTIASTSSTIASTTSSINNVVTKNASHDGDTAADKVAKNAIQMDLANDGKSKSGNVGQPMNKLEYTVKRTVQSDFQSEHDFEPYCAMHSNSHKFLIWPDTPSDLTEWSYKRIRKCPTYVIPENITNTRRVKYSLSCDSGRPQLLPSFTNRSDDIFVVAMNDSCLAKFTNSCCNDPRGIPNMVHFVWYFNKEMKFYTFLSMLSMVRYVRPCLILFHGEFLPYGKYWDYIIRIYPNILHVKRPRPLYIFGKKIVHHEHSGDIMRMEALMELGGIYFDTDVIVLRDIDPLRQYDMTLCLQASGFLLNAFIMAKKNATFLTLWMDGYRKDFRNESYVFNSMYYNKDVAKARPDLIHLEKGTLCAPADLIGRPITSPLVYKWSDLFGFHLYARTIHFPWDVNYIKSFNTTMGAMVRQVVYGNKELCN